MEEEEYSASEEDQEEQEEEFEEDNDKTEADVGIIEEITLINFMCHKNLKIKLGPHINFIVGQNGSKFILQLLVNYWKRWEECYSCGLSDRTWCKSYIYK